MINKLISKHNYLSFLRSGYGPGELFGILNFYVYQEMHVLEKPIPSKPPKPYYYEKILKKYGLLETTFKGLIITDLGRQIYTEILLKHTHKVRLFK